MNGKEAMKLGLAALLVWIASVFLARYKLGKFVGAGIAGAAGHIAATAIVG